MNKRFLFILTISLVSLVALIGGIFIFQKDNSLEFKKSGYILETNKTQSNRYYFNEGTKYKENLEDKYQFIDADNSEVSTSKDNFVHYLDESISFFKHGVLLDLNSVNASIIPYYNITNKLMIEYKDGGYCINSANKTLTFDNWLGRISENKYIIAGKDISLKLPENSEKLKANYYEIVFVENGVVNIENQEVSYQVVADGTYLHVGEHIVIDLGKKKLYYDEEDKLSLTQMTIDGNENIEIVPEEEKEHTKENVVNNGNAVNNNPNENNNNVNNENKVNNENIVNNNNTVDNDNQDGTTPSESDKSIPKIELVEAKVNANKIDMTVQVIDKDKVIDGDLEVLIINATTGKRGYNKILKVNDGLANITMEALTPDSDYILSIVNGENQYFQKLFRTDTLGMSLEKNYATTNSLTYTVTISDDSSVSSVNLYLYDNDNKSVISRFLEDGSEIDYYTISKNDAKEGYDITIDGLSKNSSYTAVVNNVVYNSVEYIDKYTISRASKTLKKKPIVTDLDVKADIDNSLFNLSIDTIEDEDKSITKYSYLIYKAEDLSLGNTNAEPIKVIEKKDDTEIKLNIDGKQIVEKQDYRFRVLVEYYDNEKYGEYLTELSEPFLISDNKIVVNFTLNEDRTSFNKIVGIAKLVDDNCLVSISGRTCYDAVNNFTLEYKIVNTTNTKTITDFSFNPDSLESELSLEGLMANSIYEINIYGDVNLKDGYGVRKGYLLGTFKASTKEIDSLIVTSWNQNESTRSEPINVNAKISSLNSDDSLINSVNSITFNIYKGSLTSINEEIPLKTIVSTGNIKTKYYDEIFSITSSNTFGINLANLRSLSGDRLNKYYTIEITNAIDSENINTVPIENNLFIIEMPPILIIEDEIEDPDIEVTPIQNQSLGTNKNIELNNDTEVGYKVIANFSASDLYTYFDEKDIKSINFYAYDSMGREVGKKVLTLPATNYQVDFMLGNGTSYITDDYNSCNKENSDDYSCLIRGNSYTFKYNISINTGSSVQTYPSNMVTSEVNISKKQAPKYKMFIEGSTISSITYKYQLMDIDNALYKDTNNSYNFYYKVNNVSQNSLELKVDNDYATSKSNYNSFNKDTASKSITLTGLSNNSPYEIFIKRALTKTNSSADVEDVSIGKYTFDGLYSASSYVMPYKLSYSVNDNRLKILIVNTKENAELLKRMSAYQLDITAEDNTKYTGAFTELNTCTEKGITYNCLILNYSSIVQFKGKDTEVRLYGYYDTGKYLGFNMPQNNLSILQTNSTEKGQGQYLKQVTNGALSLTDNPVNTYTLTLNSPYQFSTQNNINNGVFKLGSKIQLSLTYTERGASGRFDVFSDVVNIKEVAKTELTTENDYFRFDSITPKISVNTTSTINGAIMSIETEDITSQILKEEFVPENQEYYFYVDIYKNATDTEVYRQIKVKYDELSSFEIDKFLPETTYYYKVYAYMYKNGTSTYTRLFDKDCPTCTNDYVTIDYSFTTLNKNDIYFNTTNGIGNKTDYYERNPAPDYTNRLLYATTRLYKINNFTLKYEIIKDDNVLYTWNVDELKGETDIKQINSNIDISGNDFVFGSGYYKLKVYAVTPVLDDELEDSFYEYVLYDGPINISELIDPSFAVTKSAGYTEEEGYYLDFKITPIDKNNVIKNGKYYVKLLDSNNNLVEEINDLDATEFNNLLRFKTNLVADSEYNLVVYADVYKNNISLVNKELSEEVALGTYTNSTVKEQYVMYTVGEANVSLGTLVIDAFEDNATVSFVGGANINGDGNDILGITEAIFMIKQGSNIIASDCYVMGENTPNHCTNESGIYNRKNFLYTTSDDYYKLVINPPGLKLSEEVVYTVNLSFYSGDTLLRGRSMSYPMIYIKE